MSNEYDHESMINILSKFENVGPSHMSAPNDEGKLGYGGHCFPKDTQAFLDFSNSEIIKQVIKTNEKLRGIDDHSRND
jgi:UDPglucose 6-dehydrogenase